MLVLPIIFCVIFPGIAVGFGSFTSFFDSIGNDTEKIVESFLKSLPNGTIKDEISKLSSLSHKFVYIFVNYFLINLFLLVPIFSASILSANSFVGEKERRTLESLLFAPISIKELFVGKVLASFIPSAFVSLLSFILCGIVVNLLAYSMFDKFIFPSSNWLIMIFWLVPMLTIFCILLNVFISARVKSFQEAQQLGGMIVIPVIALLIGQVSGIVFLGKGLMLLIGGVLFVINLLFLHQIAKKNNRQILFEKQIH